MAARIDNGRVQLLTRTGLDWTDKYPSAIAALANLNVKTAYLDGELCGVDEAGLPTFAHTQAATDGERNVQLVYYAFDLLHLDGWDISGLQLIERKALLEPLLVNKPGLQFNGHEVGDGAHSEARRQARVRGRRLKDGRRALRARQSWTMAQSQMAEPARVRHRRLDRPGRISSASRGAAIGLLHR